jgi:hypothetical protein
MKRIASTILMASLLAPAGPVAVAAVWSGGVAWAEVSDKEMEDQLAKIKKMVADIEMKMKSKKMAMDAMGKEKTMKMLMDVTKMLRDIESQAP